MSALLGPGIVPEEFFPRVADRLEDYLRHVSSLSLALALSDLVSGKTTIESLFLDEGFGTLDQETLRQLGGLRNPTFLDSHPVTAERVQDTAARARSLSVVPAAPIARDRADFLGRLDGLLLGPDPAEGVFQGRRFLHPGLDFALEFPSGWKTVNQKQAVGASGPDGQALIVLQGQGATGNPAAAAQASSPSNPPPANTPQM